MCGEKASSVKCEARIKGIYIRVDIVLRSPSSGLAIKEAVGCVSFQVQPYTKTWECHVTRFLIVSIVETRLVEQWKHGERVFFEVEQYWSVERNSRSRQTP